jgi:hypothetical protein
MWGVWISTTGLAFDLIGALLLVWDVAARDRKTYRPTWKEHAEYARFAKELFEQMGPDIGNEREKLLWVSAAVGLRKEFRRRNQWLAESRIAQVGAGLILAGLGLQIVGLWMPYLMAVGSGG